jgi:puromycin-sensitive aminopeptidase
MAAQRGARLDPAVRPSQQDIRVELDPARGDGFRGETSIRLEIGAGRGARRRSLELHAKGLRVARARLETSDGARRGRVVRRPEWQTVEIDLGAPLPPGPATLHLSFSGRLRRDLCGLYAARSGEHRYAFTQLEPAEARSFFPCFDEPSLKARFALSVTTAAEHAVVSNSPVAREVRHPDGTKTVHFERTPPLSTYLIALAVGALEGSEPEYAGATPIRVWHAPGKAHLTAFAREAARETLVRLERYFDLPYPYAKLDLVAVPDFEFGAMENAGAVFFRETLLLVDPATVTQAERKRAAEVICHELAHMWYGDLVTMAWWDDLWLNEAFATWMAFHVVDQWKPDWKMWHDFQHHRAMALEQDALAHTHPIYAEVRTPEEANENFDVITYEKGASVVRMIERYLGPEIFRDGVRRYVRRHRESNAVAADLWNALGEASGQRVEPVVRAWIEQEGYPVVEVRGADAGAVELRQRRFRESEPRRRPTGGARRRPEPRWPVPWVGRTEHGLARHLLSRRRERVPLPRGAGRVLYGNADEGGFFRPLHADFAALLDGLAGLPAVERMGLVDHQWALVRAGLAPLTTLLDLADALGDEPDADVLLTLERPLATLIERLAPRAGPGSAPRLRRWLADRFGPALDALGLDPSEGEPLDTRLRRAALLDVTGRLAQRDDLVDAARERVARYLADRSALDPDLADAIVSIAAAHGDAELHAALRAAMRSSGTPQEQRRFLLALGDVRVPALVDASLELTLGDEIATQDVVFLLVRLLTNPAAGERSWRFVKRRWARLRRRMPPLLVPRLVRASAALGTPEWRRDVAAFFRAHPVPSGARALKQALERFDWWAGFARRAGPELGRALETRRGPHA